MGPWPDELLWSVIPNSLLVRTGFAAINRQSSFSIWPTIKVSSTSVRAASFSPSMLACRRLYPEFNRRKHGESIWQQGSIDYRRRFGLGPGRGTAHRPGRGAIVSGRCQPGKFGGDATHDCRRGSRGWHPSYRGGCVRRGRHQRLCPTDRGQFWTDWRVLQQCRDWRKKECNSGLWRRRISKGDRY